MCSKRGYARMSNEVSILSRRRSIVRRAGACLPPPYIREVNASGAKGGPPTLADWDQVEDADFELRALVAKGLVKESSVSRGSRRSAYLYVRHRRQAPPNANLPLSQGRRARAAATGNRRFGPRHRASAIGSDVTATLAVALPQRPKHWLRSPSHFRRRTAAVRACSPTQVATR